ncbi:hypothetical protein IJ843_03510 [bacterium]|nr:hypothetical protein [bacterium]
MGIIGVVAALTLPNLNSSTGDKEKVAKVKKIYSNLEDAYGRATAVYGPIDEWIINDSTDVAKTKRISERMLEFMKTTKTGVDDNIYYANLADGSYIDFSYNTPNYSSDTSSPLYNAYIGYIYVDIDGENKGQSLNGYDVFGFFITKQGIYPKGSRLDDYGKDDNALKTFCFAKTDGYYMDGEKCTAWIIENGNMDYFKATNGTCPNGTILSWTNTTCK